jgi:hypothetical protein
VVIALLGQRRIARQSAGVQDEEQEARVGREHAEAVRIQLVIFGGKWKGCFGAIWPGRLMGTLLARCRSAPPAVPAFSWALASEHY